MARYQPLDPRMHDDDKFIDLSDSQQMLWVTILTGPQTNACPGIWIGGVGTLAEIRRRPYEEVAADLAVLEQLGMVEMDSRHRVMRVPRAPRYQDLRNADQLRSWKKGWDTIPECDAKYRHAISLREAVVRNEKGAGWWDTVFGTVLDTVSDTVPPHCDPPSGTGAGSGIPPLTPPAVAEGEREEGAGSASARKPDPDTGGPDDAPPATARPRGGDPPATAPPKKIASRPAPDPAREVLVRVWRDVKGRGRDSPTRPGRSWARFDRALRDKLTDAGVTAEDGGPRLVDAMRAYLACDEDWCASHPLSLFLRHFDRWWQGNPAGRKTGGLVDVGAEAMRMLGIERPEDRANEPRVVDVECESQPVGNPAVAGRGAEPLPGPVLDPVDAGRPRDRGGGAAERRAAGAG